MWFTITLCPFQSSHHLCTFNPIVLAQAIPISAVSWLILGNARHAPISGPAFFFYLDGIPCVYMTCSLPPFRSSFNSPFSVRPSCKLQYLSSAAPHLQRPFLAKCFSLAHNYLLMSKEVAKSKGLRLLPSLISLHLCLDTWHIHVKMGPFANGLDHMLTGNTMSQNIDWSYKNKMKHSFKSICLGK